MTETIVHDKENYNLQAYINAEPEERLRMLYEIKPRDAMQAQFFRGQMMAITIDMDEHPEWFDEGCLCESCRSYGDG